MDSVSELLLAASDQNPDVSVPALAELKQLSTKEMLYEELVTIILSNDEGDESALRVRKLASIAFLHFISRIDKTKNSELFARIKEISFEIWQAAKDEVICGHIVSIYKIFINDGDAESERFYSLLNQLIESILREESAEYTLFVLLFIKEFALSRFIAGLEEQVQLFLSQICTSETLGSNLLFTLSLLSQNENLSVTFIEFCIQYYYELRGSDCVDVKAYWNYANLIPTDRVECLYPLVFEDFLDDKKEIEARLSAFSFIVENIHIVTEENIESVLQTAIDLLVYLIENDERDDYLYVCFFKKLINENGFEVFENYIHPEIENIAESSENCLIAFFFLHTIAIKMFPKHMEQYIDQCLDFINENFAELFSNFTVASQIKNYLENITEQSYNYYIDRGRMEQLGSNLLEFVEACEISDEFVEMFLFDLLEIVASINHNFASETLILFVRNIENFSESSRTTSVAYSLISYALFIPLSIAADLGQWLIAHATSEEVGTESEIDSMERRVDAFIGLVILKSKYNEIENEGFEDFFNEFIIFVFEKTFECDNQEDKRREESDESDIFIGFECTESINGRHQRMKQKIVKTLIKSNSEGRYKDPIIENSVELFEHLREITPKDNLDLIQDIDMFLLLIANTKEAFDNTFQRAFAPIEYTFENYPCFSIDIIFNYINKIDITTYATIIRNIGVLIESSQIELVNALKSALRKTSPDKETKIKILARHVFHLLYQKDRESALELMSSIAPVDRQFANEFLVDNSEEIAQIFDINNPEHLILAGEYIKDLTTIEFFVELIEREIDKINDSLFVIRRGLWRFITKLLEASYKSAEKFIDYAKESYAAKQDEPLETLLLALEAMRPGSIEQETVFSIMGRFPPTDKSECSNQIKFFLLILKANPTQEYFELGAKIIVLFYATGPLALQITPNKRDYIIEIIKIIPIETIEKTLKTTELTSATASEKLYLQICSKKEIKNEA